MVGFVSSLSAIPRDGALILQPGFRMREGYCSRFQLTRSPSVVVELETGAL